MEVLRDLGRDVAVRVDEGEARAVVDVGQEEMAHHRRLAGAGRPDQQDVALAGFRPQPEFLAAGELPDVDVRSFRVHGPAAEP